MVSEQMAHGSQCIRLFFVAWLCFCTVSCSSPREPENAKKTVPVSGIITVDGEPGEGVKVILNPKEGADRENPTLSVGFVNKEGKYTIGTYTRVDGAPPGEYVLTFIRFDTTKLHIGGDPPDMFGGKYSDPETSEHTLSVPENADNVEVPTIELTSAE